MCVTQSLQRQHKDTQVIGVSYFTCAFIWIVENIIQIVLHVVVTFILAFKVTPPPAHLYDVRTGGSVMQPIWSYDTSFSPRIQVNPGFNSFAFWPYSFQAHWTFSLSSYCIVIASHSYFFSSFRALFPKVGCREDEPSVLQVLSIYLFHIPQHHICVIWLCHPWYTWKPNTKPPVSGV